MRVRGIIVLSCEGDEPSTWIVNLGALFHYPYCMWNRSRICISRHVNANNGKWALSDSFCKGREACSMQMKIEMLRVDKTKRLLSTTWLELKATLPAIVEDSRDWGLVCFYNKRREREMNSFAIEKYYAVMLSCSSLSHLWNYKNTQDYPFHSSPLVHCHGTRKIVKVLLTVISGFLIKTLFNSCKIAE